MPWMLLLAAVPVLGGIVAGVLLGRRRAGGAGAAPIARAERIRSLPGVRAAVRRRRLTASALVALAVVAVATGGLVAARPMSVQSIEPETRNRDIVLCLDVSGSMTEVDAEVLDVFQQLLPGFEGERIGLTIFNSSPVQIFPLTDDYDFIEEHLTDMRDSFDFVESVPEHWVGTLNGPGGSLIGDGLAACALGFDRPEDDRSRSIIFATDNEINGAETVTLQQGADFARSLGVRLYSIDPIFDPADPTSAALADAARSTGGEAFGLRETTTVGDIVAEVQRQDATLLRGEAEVVIADDPGVWPAVLFVIVAGLVVVAWRVRA